MPKNHLDLIDLIDMDGTSVPFDETAQDEFHRIYPDVPRPVRMHFALKEDYPEEHQDTIKAIYNRPGYCADLPPYPGFLEGWELLLALGRRPRFCSSPLALDPEGSIRDKKLWIIRNMVPDFGRQVLEEAIFTKDKADYDGRHLLDDKPSIDNSEKATWTQIIYDQPYNRAAEGLRLHGWLAPNLAELFET